MDRWTEERKTAMLLKINNKEPIEVFRTFVFAQPDDKDEFDKVLKFDEYCLLKKARESNTDPYLAFASCTQHVPLPHTNIDTDKNNIVELTNKRIEHRQKRDFDRATRVLEPLQERDVLRREDPDAWTRKATVCREVGPRSYTVRTECGQVFRRHRRSLKTSEDILRKWSLKRMLV